MLDEADQRLLQEARRWEDPGPPTWKEGWWNLLLVVGGLVLVVTTALEGHGLTGAAGGFMLGVGLLALLMNVTIARRFREALRLVRHADEAGAYDDVAGRPSDATRE